MTDFFGVPTTLIMFVLIALFVLSLIAVGLVALRNHVLFAIGLRNIPRRRAQSILIVLGLMLSTVIVSAALTTGDTVQYSITNETFTRLGHADELLQVRDNRSVSLKKEQIASTGDIPANIVDGLIADLNGNPDVDGVLPVLRFPAPVTNDKAKLTEPEVAVIGLDAGQMSGFEDDLVTRTGVPFNMAQVGQADALVNQSTADALDLNSGGNINIFINGTPRQLTVIGVVQDRFITGWTQGQPNGVVVRLATAEFMTGTQRPGFVIFSNTGGVRDSLGRTDAVKTRR